MPAQRAHALLRAHAWPDHPLGRSIAGQTETIQRLTREDVIYFVHEHYMPDRFIIAAAGNLEHGDFVAQVRDAFWRMMGHSQLSVDTPPEYQSGAIIEYMPVSQVYFSLGVRAYPYAHPDRYSLHVLNNVLGGGISSRLFRRIRIDRGLAYHIGSEYHAYCDDGMLVVEGCTAPENILQVLELTMDELWKLFNANELLNEEELWKAKMQLRGQHLISGENTNTQMSRIATQEFYFGNHIPDREILAQIESINIQALQRFAGDALKGSLNQATLAVVGPKAPDHYSASQVTELLADYHRKTKEGG
jgi:predicted Zn-dependent peptidase